MKRPFGVTFLAIVFLFAGIYYIVAGLQMTTSVTFGPVPTGTGAWFWGWVIVLTGVAFWAGGLAAWSLQRWGWQLGMILAVWGLLQAFFIMLGQGNIGEAAAATGFPLILLWYLNRKSVKDAFGIPESDA